MSDRLTDAELSEVCDVFGPSLRLTALVIEVREHRAALAADEERVRSVVREAIEAGYGFAVDNAEISEHDGWHRTAPTIEWPLTSKIEEHLDAITTRAAKQLASAAVRMTEEDREALGWLLDRMTDDILGKHGGHGMRDFQMLTDARALIVRLLATVRP